METTTPGGGGDAAHNEWECVLEAGESAAQKSGSYPCAGRSHCVRLRSTVSSAPKLPCAA
jgi:hypothetical protein